jgi:2'-5' RNA ligase
MQPDIVSIPGYKVNEYLLIVRPHDELWNKIVDIKKEFSEKYEAPQAKWGQPHLTLVKFVQFEMMEPKILNRLKNLAMAQYPFKIELRDFGSFPSHTVYINVTTKVPLQNLVKEIRQDAQRLMKLDPNDKPYFIMEPHLTISRKLKPWQYEKSWEEYNTRHFTGRFIADEMILLKRPQGELKYGRVARLPFENLPVGVKQGELFG